MGPGAAAQRLLASAVTQHGGRAGRPGRGGAGRAHRYKAQAAAERAGVLPPPPHLPTSPSPGVSSPLPGAPRDSEGGAQGVWGCSWGSQGGGLERPEPGMGPRGGRAGVVSPGTGLSRR